ncbi:RHS repeat domain-containing protein, partial [Myxococcus sp. RHSTA-1-4]|uniref:RHS repeat domain-containing protein n=1 Tax=Myxococcus sp. RHSTA-1-4 TaxID=2874601 RepID=UPI00272EB729
VQDIYPLGTPEQRVTTFELASSNGRRTAMTDALGRRTEFEHDAHGNLTKVTKLAGTPQATSIQYTYTAENRLASIRDELGHLSVYEYDAQGNVSRFEDATGRFIEYTHDSQGRMVSKRAGTDAPTTFFYEGADLVAVTNGAGLTTQFVRDALGRAVARRSPGGQVNRYEYDARDRLIKHTNALGHVTSFAYDKTGNFTLLRDARGKETLYSYNSLGLLSERTDSLARTEVYGYDAAGRLKTFRDQKGQVMGWNYDTSGAEVLVGFGATVASPESFTSSIQGVYDAAGRLVRLEDSLGPVITYAYDGFDRLTQEVSPSGTVDYTYDAAGRLTSMTSSGQAQIVYAYDDADRLTSITQGSRTVSFTYDAAGRRASTVLPGGVSQTYTYDAAGRLTRVEYTRGSVFLGDLTYTLDANGDRISVGGTYARTGLPEAVAGAVYDAASQLTAWKGRTLTYDANGSLESDGLKTYTWDARGQLARVSDSLATLAEFTYDPTGRRSRKSVAGVTTDYHYSGPTIIQERRGGTTTGLLTGFGLDEVYSRTTSADSRDYLTDALGSTVALADGTGALTAAYTYEPYGASELTGDAFGNTQSFTGREDDGNGLYYFRARYYEPETGRFLQSEPMLHEPGYVVDMALKGHVVPAYAYAANNPLYFVDPTGLAFDEFCWAKCIEEVNPLENNPLFGDDPCSSGFPWGTATALGTGALPKFFGYRPGASHFTSIWRYMNIGSRSAFGRPVFAGPTTKALGRGSVYLTLGAGLTSWGVIGACAVECSGR